MKKYIFTSFINSLINAIVSCFINDSNFHTSQANLSIFFSRVSIYSFFFRRLSCADIQVDTLHLFKEKTILLVTKPNLIDQKISTKLFLPYFLFFVVFFSVTFLRSQKGAIFAVLDNPPRSTFVSLPQLNVILQLHLSADQR